MSDTRPRQAIVEALDDLDERDNLTYKQRTATDRAYPPSVVEERLQVLRRRQWWVSAVLIVVMLGTIAASTGAVLEVWTPAFLVGLLPGIAALAGIAVQVLLATAKTIQLYTVLQRIDRGDAGTSASAEPD